MGNGPKGAHMTVNPARAGMILTLNSPRPSKARKPRACGDDPDPETWAQIVEA